MKRNRFSVDDLRVAFRARADATPRLDLLDRTLQGVRSSRGQPILVVLRGLQHRRPILARAAAVLVAAAVLGAGTSGRFGLDLLGLPAAERGPSVAFAADAADDEADEADDDEADDDEADEADDDETDDDETDDDETDDDETDDDETDDDD